MLIASLARHRDSRRRRRGTSPHHATDRVPNLVPVAAILAREANACGHQRVPGPVGIAESRLIQLETCDQTRCPRQVAAYRRLVDAGELVPNVRTEWQVGR